VSRIRGRLEFVTHGATHVRGGVFALGVAAASRDGSASIDGEHRTGGKRRSVAGEVDDRADDLVGLTDPLGRQGAYGPSIQRRLALDLERGICDSCSGLAVIQR
jgi:hypothetical protein